MRTEKSKVKHKSKAIISSGQGFGAHLTSVVDWDENTFVQQLHGWDVIWVGLKQDVDSGSDELSNFEWSDGSTFNSAAFNYFIEQGGRFR